MSTAVLEGLSLNPAAPADVLIRLVDLHGTALRRELTSRPLPALLVDAMLRHPERGVRAILAANPHVDLRVRVRLTEGPEGITNVRHDRRNPLPPEAVDLFLEQFEGMVRRGVITEREAREELGMTIAEDRRLLPFAARHPNPNVRATAVSFRKQLAPADLAALRADDAPAVREAFRSSAEGDARTTELSELIPVECFTRSLQLSRRLTPEVLRHVLERDDVRDLQVVAANPYLPADAVATLLAHLAPQVRSAIAHRTDLTADQVAHLARDPHPLVRNAISVHPALTETQRATIPVDLRYVPGEGDFGPNCRHSTSWRIDPFWTPDEVSRWARSSNVLLRRRAARSPELSPSLVPVLADDGDLGVRVLLALHSPDAPPSLLLDSYLEYTGCGREELLRKTGFPREDLGRYWCDPDPALRMLAARDLDARPHVADALLRDPVREVREAIAASPLLPPQQIEALLDSPDLARAAASNPALPAAAMRRLLP